MKRKELNNLAKKIAKAELIIQKSQDSNKIEQAKKDIIKLSGQVSSLEEVVLLDELVQQYFSKID